MRKIVLLNYNNETLSKIRNEKLIIKSNSLDYVEEIYGISISVNQLIALVIDLPYTAVSQIEFKEEWDRIPLIVYAYNIGNYDLFLYKVPILRNLNIRIFLSSKSESVFSDLKIMSSLGIDCGLLIEKDYPINDEKFLDLASYAYMSPVQHASIQPFEYILCHLRDESKRDFSMIYFDDQEVFIDLDEHLSENILGSAGIDGSHCNINITRENFYSHFHNLDKCSKCPAFKVCNKKMEVILNDCERAMSEIYEYAEMRDNLNNNQRKVNLVCQL